MVHVSKMAVGDEMPQLLLVGDHLNKARLYA